MTKEKILVVDDHPDVRIFVRACLEGQGFSVIEAENGREALRLFKEVNPALLILDLSIGQPDGFEVCREIRKASNVPIIMLTSHDQELDEAMCLAAGADDYITKPVSDQILTLRVNTQMRHRSARAEPLSTKITVGGLGIDSSSYEFTVEGIPVPLTRTEFEFLKLLMTKPKHVYTRDQVIEAVGGSVIFSSDHVLDTHASRLRMKIKSVGGPKAIHSVRGVGYRLFE
jgi:two-component system OmpR family response regulator